MKFDRQEYERGLRKLRVFMVHSQNNAVGWYRIQQPAKWLNDSGLAEVRTTKFFFHNAKEIPLAEIEKQCIWADIIVYQRLDTQYHVARIKATQDLNKPVLAETDDFVQLVPPYNPGARFYHPNSEASNQWANVVLKISDGVLVTTEGLRRLYYQLNKNILICPNFIDTGWWTNPAWTEKPARKHPDTVIIGWQGANAHSANLEIIQPIIPRILEKYPHAEFHYVAYPLAWISDLKRKFKDRVKLHKWVFFTNHPRKISSYGFDIGLAPLVDNFFNRGKSGLRVLEYGINKTAVVASPLPAYKEIIGKGIYGIIAKEKQDWYSAISKLVEDVRLRNSFKRRIYRKVIDCYTQKQGAKTWSENLHKALLDYHRKYPDKGVIRKQLLDKLEKMF